MKGGYIAMLEVWPSAGRWKLWAEKLDYWETVPAGSNVDTRWHAVAKGSVNMWTQEK